METNCKVCDACGMRKTPEGFETYAYKIGISRKRLSAEDASLRVCRFEKRSGCINTEVQSSEVRAA